MACPYFYPVERHAGELSTSSVILPLGDAWTGVCGACEGPPQPVEETRLRPLCSFGYARGRCELFPRNDAGPDATRFAITSDDGASLALAYVQERDHHPFAHGSLQYSRTGRRFDPEPAGAALARQAQAYVESYLRRKGEAWTR